MSWPLNSSNQVNGIAILENYSQNKTVPMESSASNLDVRAHNAAFVTTNWSVVLTAREADSAAAQAALAELCETYWYAIYAYVRRRGHMPENAADLTQAFFARFLEKNFLGDLTPGTGR